METSLQAEKPKPPLPHSPGSLSEIKVGTKTLHQQDATTSFTDAPRKQFESHPITRYLVLMVPSLFSPAARKGTSALAPGGETLRSGRSCPRCPCSQFLERRTRGRSLQCTTFPSPFPLRLSVHLGPRSSSTPQTRSPISAGFAEPPTLPPPTFPSSR